MLALREESLTAMDKTKIQWTQGDDGSAGATWNPFRGCRRVSPGCKNCYAEAIAARFSKPGMPYHGFATMTPSGPRWTGKVGLISSKLEEPIHWKKPRRIFVCSMSDLFYEEATADMIQAVVDVMMRAPQHTYIVLTKRAERLAELLPHMRLPGGMKWGDRPPEHVWVGVSVEDPDAVSRVPFLLKTPAAVRFLSVEPLLAPVDITPHLSEWGPGHVADQIENAGVRRVATPRLDWVIVGGESGDEARSMDLEWALKIVRDCKKADVPVFVKQLGARPIMRETLPGLCGRGRGADGICEMRDAKGGDPEEWPTELRVREFPKSRVAEEPALWPAEPK